jgi:hypothetical protein
LKIALIGFKDFSLGKKKNVSTRERERKKGRDREKEIERE